MSRRLGLALICTVISLHFAAEGLGRIRFAFSPLWETVTSLRVLGSPGPNRLHRPWLDRVPPRLGDVDLELLTAVVRPAGYIPDFLVPSPPHRAANFASGLAQVAAADPADVEAQLSHLAGHPVAQHGPGREARTRLIRGLADTPAAARDRIVAELEATGGPRSPHTGGAWRGCCRPTSPTGSRS
jgi:hypothetical protein